VIKTVRIYPPIGIARLGNSKNGYFIGPETPGQVVVPPDGFRDAEHLIKRQAARFHLFAYDENDALIQEITSNDATIKWTVSLANTKAAAEWFHPKSELNPRLRNANFTGDRDQLKLAPGEQSVSGKNPGFKDLGTSHTTGAAKDLQVKQQFLDKPVQFVLGTITTDDQGLLVVLGGYGESKSPIGASLAGGDFANHDGWYDDVSDGLVSAEVTLADGSTPLIENAWVIVAPPKYAPGLQSVVTLFDTLYQSAIDRGLMHNPFSDPAFKPSLAADIVPILMRAANMRWVYDNGTGQFSSAGFHNSFNQMPPANRAKIFNMLSMPSNTPGEPGTGGSMPKMWSDLYPNGPNGTLTRTQYKMIEMWKDGNFVTDVPPSTLGSITPDGLTRAALEPCVGAAFYPGIEASWKIRDIYAFAKPFRLDSGALKPGDITSQMSLPWQSDFLDCAVESGNFGDDLVWWPAQRPIAVLTPGGGNTYVPWGRANASGSAGMNVQQMITDWYKLGFVLAQSNGRYEEVSRL
jgi:L-Lysine epsilon oxidase N-terminal/L-lysine epsilon oxidase C-terminal domain